LVHGYDILCQYKYRHEYIQLKEHISTLQIDIIFGTNPI
jgi:hypothetical protein